MLPFKPVQTGASLLLAVFISLAAAAAACTSPVPPPVPEGIDGLQPSTATTPAPAVPASDEAQAPAPGLKAPTPDVVPEPVSAVQIKLIHYRGTLTRIGCCNPGLYERDEFVVIQNIGQTHQDITGWRLTNITRGYPTFIFPSLFPCIPYELPAPDLTEETISPESYYTLTQNPAQSEINRFSTSTQQSKPANVPNSEVDWSSCTPLEPLDETPMKPARGQQGLPLPCILYPGQTVLVFTDEVHCQAGGFSFNWGLGNIWNNEIADTAVLYNARGEEISRRSYLTGR